MSDLPTQVARTREALAGLLARLDPDAAARAAAPPPPARPTVVLVGAPGRGRGELLASLLGLDAVPGRGADGRCGRPTATRPRRRDPGTWPMDWATAALVLADAAAPLGAEELAALARGAGRVDTVVFALTRTDAHRGWRTVLEADRALVAEHVPRLAGAPWFPVAAALARRAGSAASPAVAEALRRRSGIAALQRELHRLVARRRRMLAEANALRLLAAGLDGVATRAEATRAALRAPATGDLARRRDELLAARAALRRDHHTRWRADLAGARVAAADDLAERVRALAASTRARIDAADRAGLAAVPRERADEVEPLAAAVVEGLGARLRALVAATLADLVPADELPALRVAEFDRGDAGLVPPPRARPAEDRLLVVAGASGGLGLSRLALLPLLAVPLAPAALGVALVPVSVGLGLGAAGWVARARRLAADRAHLRQWTAEALAEVRGDLDRVLADALITTEREVTLALDAALEHRARELEDAVSAADRAVRHAGADRAEADRAAARTAAEAREGRDRAEALLRHLAALRERVDVPEPHPRPAGAT
ncbi:MAG: GTP-binding protein [Actinomycetospora sp.]|nr:GTP-binding protein [Actinomycetospora sp.]